MTEHSRWQTRAVQVGGIGIGGDNPIRIQSMTTIDTMDTAGSVEQTIRMIESGCELVRITAPSIREAENLQNIKDELRKRGYQVPLVADIHFTPNAAEVAARIVEKVRVNPGNYADKKRFQQIVYTDQQYQNELERIHEKFSPLVHICKEYGTAMRIGTNHGSLSDRIMSRYGDTPKGMVESALEFIRICEDHHYYDLVISMKSSNPIVMVEAYRLLVQEMVKEGMNYPLHLGVTEAGDGDDGRIKSAVGIGTLLEDGIGDTIRVSLTEEPEFEAPVARALIKRYVGRTPEKLEEAREIITLTESQSIEPYDSKEAAAFIGGSLTSRVVVDISRENLKDPFILKKAGFRYDVLLDKFHVEEQSADFVYFADELPSFNMPGNLKQLYNYNTWLKLQKKDNCHPIYTLKEYLGASEKDSQLNFIRIKNDTLISEEFGSLEPNGTLVFILETDHLLGMAEQRQFFENLKEVGIDFPVIIKRSYPAELFRGPWGNKMHDEEPLSKLQLYAATDIGALLIEGMGNGIWLDAPVIPAHELLKTSFGILQATRTRISKTEYISCPSCGRTLFDLQETTQKIRSRTNHLKGLKIGIMGCIVNGPGEMADADYGYVGAGPNKITLYRGKEVVKRNVDSEQALDELIDIIKEDGLWIDEN